MPAIWDVVASKQGIAGIALLVLWRFAIVLVKYGVIPPMTKENGFWTVKSIINYLFIIIMVGVIGSLALEFYSQSKTIAPSVPKETTFRLIPDTKSEPLFNDDSPKVELGSLHEFTLSNPQTGLAIIQSIEVEVLDSIEDPWGTTSAFVHNYEYKVTLNPKSSSKQRLQTVGLSYAPGDVDRHSVMFQSESGYDYFLRFVITWQDALSEKTKNTYSEVFVAAFPSFDNLMTMTRDEVGRKSEEHAKVIAQRLKELQAKYPKQ